MFKSSILKNGNLDLIDSLITNIEISFPSCCCLKRKIVKHFFNVRSLCLKNFSENCKSKKKVFGTASEKRKKN